jgi:hypothetical protein
MICNEDRGINGLFTGVSYPELRLIKIENSEYAPLH